MSPYGIIGTILVGLVVGIIAKWLSSGPKPQGCLLTILVGIAGAWIARLIGNNVFGWYSDGSAPGWIMSVLGAMLLLWLLRIVQNRN